MDYEVGGGWYSTRPYQILKRTWRRPDNSHRKFALQITNPRRRRVSKVWQTYFKERMTFEWLYRLCQNYSHQNWDRLLLRGLNLKEYSNQSGLIVAKWANQSIQVQGETELKWQHPRADGHILECKTRWEQRVLNKLPMRHIQRSEKILLWDVWLSSEDRLNPMILLRGSSFSSCSGHDVMNTSIPTIVMWKKSWYVRTYGSISVTNVWKTILVWANE